MRSPLSREWLIDEVLMLLPVLRRGLGGPARSGFYEMARLEVSVDAQLSSGHVQVLIAS
ncbi:MAG TPA: hypothetical protein VHF46_03665 [Rubrobacteraceae bacterium]|nr:hypothetical protein [Rubrobacteraceae bacterium]